jgi:hypothetical protein
MDKKTASSLLLATLQSTFLWGCILRGCNNRFCGGRGHDPRCSLVTYLRVAIRDLCRLGICAGVLKTSSNYSGLDCHGGAFSRIFVGMALLGFGPD